jgi:HSP20 family molecular chaperone IbpA
MPMVKKEPWLKDRELFPFEVPRWMEEFMEAGGPRSMPLRFRMVRPEKGVFVVPRLDLQEEKNTLIAKIEVPGIERERLTVTVKEGMLTVEGSRKTEAEVQEQEWYYAERATGGFARTIVLPCDVDTGTVTATLHNGLLEVRLPKAAEAKARERTIKIT